MIASLRGTLLDRDDDQVTVEVGGIGYSVSVSANTARELGHLGEETFLWCHHHIREDAQRLFGFTTKLERKFFEILLTAHGVGPALALAILGVHDPEALSRAVLEQDVGALKMVPGVGPKTAERLMVELRDRLDVPSEFATTQSGAGPVVGTTAPSARADVREALAGLGYSNDEIRSAIADLPDHGTSGDLLRLALKELGTARA